jgi:tetratricopeptide (TPR) repeat protein
LNTCWSENLKRGWYRAATVLADKPEYGWARTRHYYISPEMLSKDGKNQLVVWTSFSKGPHGLIEGPLKLHNGKKQIDLKGIWKIKPASELSFREKISGLRISFDNTVTGTFNAFKAAKKITVCGIPLDEKILASTNYKETQDKGIEQYKDKDYLNAIRNFALAAKLASTPAAKYMAIFYIGASQKQLRNFTGAAEVYKELQQIPGISRAQKDNAYIQYILNLYWGRKYKEVIEIADNTLAGKGASDKIKLKSCDLGYLSARNLRLHPKSIEFAKSLAVYDKDPAGHWNARSLIFQALALRLMKRYDDALAMLPEDKIKKMHPDRQGDAYIAIGEIYDSMGKYKQAAAAYTKAAKAAKHKTIIKTATAKKNNSLKKVK